MIYMTLCKSCADRIGRTYILDHTGQYGRCTLCSEGVSGELYAVTMPRRRRHTPHQEQPKRGKRKGRRDWA